MNRRQFLKTCSAATLAAMGASSAVAQTTRPSTLRSTPYILGADISWLLEDEAQGATYWDRGVRKDIFDILPAYGFNYIRARIFVNPGAPGGYASRRQEAFCDLEHTKMLARLIQGAGMGFLLSCHYSDTWADPGHQAKPADWANLPFPKLVDTVHDWTANVMKELAANQTPPDMVSIGNETSGGMLFPDGRATNFDNFARLTDAGCLAVREIDPKIPIALHNDRGRDNAFNQWWLDRFLARHTHFDIVGMSCYNEAHPGDWERNFNDLPSRYPQLSFLAMEYSYQKRYLNDLIFNAPGNKGLGSFIWEPTRWREAIFDHNGQNAGDDMGGRPHLPASTLPALDAPNQPTYRPAKPPANPDGYIPPATRPGMRAASRPASRPYARPTRGGRYDTNSYLLAYPAMAKAYGIAK